MHGQRIDAAFENYRVVDGPPLICSIQGALPAYDEIPSFQRHEVVGLDGEVHADFRSQNYFPVLNAVEHEYDLVVRLLRLGTYPQKKQEAQRQNQKQNDNF